MSLKYCLKLLHYSSLLFYCSFLNTTGKTAGNVIIHVMVVGFHHKKGSIVSQPVNIISSLLLIILYIRLNMFTPNYQNKKTNRVKLEYHCQWCGKTSLVWLYQMVHINMTMVSILYEVSLINIFYDRCRIFSFTIR